MRYYLARCIRLHDRTNVYVLISESLFSCITVSLLCSKNEGCDSVFTKLESCFLYSGLGKQIPSRNRDRPMSFQTCISDSSCHSITHRPSQPISQAKKQSPFTSALIVTISSLFFNPPSPFKQSLIDSSSPTIPPITSNFFVDSTSSASVSSSSHSLPICSSLLRAIILSLTTAIDALW